MRLKPAGHARRRTLVQVLGLAMAASAWIGSPALATTGPFETDRSSTEYMLVLDPQQSPGEIDERLTEAGFPAAERIPGLPPRYRNYRLIEIASASAETKAELLAVDGVLAVRPVYRTRDADYPILSVGQVIAKFEPGTTLDQVNTIAADHGCTIARQIAGLPQVYVLNVADESAGDAYAVSNAIAQEPIIVYTHPSLLFKLEKHQAATEILDPLYPWQWHLNNTGQLEGAVPDADIDAPEAWTITMGENAIVGVIDDSIQWEHEDLIDNYLTGYDFLGSDLIDYGFAMPFMDPAGEDDDPSPYFGPDISVGDPIGEAHGTATSGLICARANSIGVRGVAPFARLIGCKIGLGFFYTTDQDVADAFLFAEQSGAMAINNSWGGPGGALLPLVPNTFLLPDLISDTIEVVSRQGRGGKGVLVLFSSGNGSTLISVDNVYATLDTVMSIGATLRDDTLTCYSAYGPEQSVVAPGGGFAPPHDYGPASYFYDFCFEYSIATTDNMQVPGHITWDLDQDGEPDPGWPIRGYNEPMKFLDVLFQTDPDDPFGIPLVRDEYALEDLEDTNYTRRFNGTSAACPVATGAAALVFSVNPGLTAGQVRNIIEHTADKVQTADGAFDVVTGHNERLGHGRVNAFQAATAALNGWSWPSPITGLRNESSQSRVRLAWSNPDWDGDGVTDEDVCSILVVQGRDGELNWRPTDGVTYSLGQEVASGVTVVADDLVNSVDLTGMPTGAFEYAVFVRNFDDFYSWGRRAEYGTSQPQPEPRIAMSVQASPTVGSPPLSVHFAGGGITSSGSWSSFAWDFGDGTTGTGAAIDHVYTAPGNYLVTLTAIDASGQVGQATVQITALSGANQLPIASIVATPNRGPAPLRVILDAGRSYDPDGTIVGYGWDLGDGSTRTGEIVEHVYVDPGPYIVTLTVTDDLLATATAVEMVMATAGSSEDAALSAEASRALPLGGFCGTGAAGGSAAGLAGLLALTLLRRRW